MVFEYPVYKCAIIVFNIFILPRRFRLKITKLALFLGRFL